MPPLLRSDRPIPAALRPRLARLARYASASAVSTAVGLSTLAILVDVGRWPAGWANVVATGLGTIPSFELNRRWVWRRDGHRSLGHEVLPFVVLCAVELVASSLVVHAASVWTARQGWDREVRTAVDLAANLATYGALWVVQYLVCDRALFGRPAADVALGAPADVADRVGR